ncbi:hypothetical protein BDY24DRAFT_438531 [Mrakia frigida]|uniref:uncharacterized protein n=1 Tax=Mrakia frigida TaxID=29902 RepID=UPI003FCBF6AC
MLHARDGAGGGIRNSLFDMFSWYNLTSLCSVLEALDSQTAQEEPSFTKKVILGYLQTKMDKGLSSSQVGEKLHVLEQAMSRRQSPPLPSFARQIAEIRAQLSLPPSKVFPPRSSRRVGTSPPTFQPPAPPYTLDYSSPHSQTPHHPYLYLPLCPFKEEDLPPYSPFAADPILRRRRRAFSSYFQHGDVQESLI